MLYRRIILYLVALAVPAFVYFYLSAEPDTTYLQNANYQLTKDMYDLYQTSSATVVMLGDSHTFNVDWNELLGRKDIANRGIRGDILPGFLQRIEQVKKLHPRFCFVMGGINDLYAHYSTRQIFHSYKKLVEELRQQGIQPILQSTMGVTTSYPQASEVNTQVADLNNVLRDYAKEEGLLFIDLHSLLCTNNALRPELSYDGLHLNAQGYAIWRNEVQAVLATIAL